MLDVMKIMQRVTNGFGTKNVSILSILTGVAQENNLSNQHFSTTKNANPNRSKVEYDPEKFNFRTVFELFVDGVNYQIAVQHTNKMFSQLGNLEEHRTVYDDFLGDKKLWKNLLLTKGGNDEIYETILTTPEPSEIAYIKVLAYGDNQTPLTRDKKGLMI